MGNEDLNLPNGIYEMEKQFMSWRATTKFVGQSSSPSTKELHGLANNDSFKLKSHGGRMYQSVSHNLST